MSDIIDLFPEKESNMSKPVRKRVNGHVSIIMNGQGLFTKPPGQKDAKFFMEMAAARQKWIRDGSPASGEVTE